MAHAAGAFAAGDQAAGVDAVNAMMHTLVRIDQPVPEQLPVELRDYLAKTLPMPEWADSDKIRRGQQLFEIDHFHSIGSARCGVA